MTGPIDRRLEELGIAIPEAHPPIAAKIEGWALHRDMLFISGAVPKLNGAPQYIGKAGREFDLAQAQAAARLSALCMLAQAKLALDGDPEPDQTDSEAERLRQCDAGLHRNPAGRERRLGTVYRDFRRGRPPCAHCRRRGSDALRRRHRGRGHLRRGLTGWLYLRLAIFATGWGARIRTWDHGIKTRCLAAWLRPTGSTGQGLARPNIGQTGPAAEHRQAAPAPQGARWRVPRYVAQARLLGMRRSWN